MSIAAYLSNLLNSSGLIVGSKIASNTIGLSNLSATGTPSASNFLRGDNTWAAAGAGTVTSITAGTGLSGGTITTSGTIALVTTAGAVGTYVCARRGNGTYAFGSTVAGSSINPVTWGITGCSAAYTIDSGSPLTGTWQLMGYANSGFSGSFSALYVRTA